MKLLVCLAIVSAFFFVAPEVAAQTTSTRPTSEQSLEQLVREVQQLRATLQRINAAMYKGQVILERLKLQQEHVSRLSRELSDTRENLSEIRTQQMRFKELASRAEAEVGMKNPNDVAGLKAEIDMFALREQRFSIRESQLANELELERAKLNELNDRLNTLELELRPE